MNNYEDAPAKILQYASQKYSKENSAGFGDKMRVLELKHQKSVEAVFKNPDVPEDFINEQFKDSPQVKPLADKLIGVTAENPNIESKPNDFNLDGENREEIPRLEENENSIPNNNGEN